MGNIRQVSFLRTQLCIASSGIKPGAGNFKSFSRRFTNWTIVVGGLSKYYPLKFDRWSVAQPGVPIFVEHWRDNLLFYPNFALFLTLEGMNLHHDFVQVSKLSEDHKKRPSPKMEHFFPRIQVDTYAQMHTSVKLLGVGCRCGPHSNYWGGYSQIIGGICPPIPRVSAPLSATRLKVSRSDPHGLQWLRTLPSNPQGGSNGARSGCG